VIQKEQSILNKMDEMFAKSVSASMMNKYLKCPLDFYYRYVLEFGEEDDFEEDVEFNTFGTFIHTVLETLYEPFARHDKKGKLKEPQPRAITSFDIDGMLKRYELLIREQFMQRYNGDEKAFTSGKNLLSFNMALELTRKFLESEKKFISEQKEPVFIEYLELEIKQPIEINVGGVKKSINLKGFIDRIDSIGSHIRIIDYKTGKVDASEVKIKLEDNLLKSFSTPKHAVQMAMYSFLYRSRFNETPGEVSLCSLIKLKDGMQSLKGGNTETLSDITDNFTAFLEQLFEEIYDTSKPFEHIGGWNSYCSYCE
jgi:RecB family exonuclease